jgi:hypothetical protein
MASFALKTYVKISCSSFKAAGLDNSLAGSECIARVIQTTEQYIRPTASVSVTTPACKVSRGSGSNRHRAACALQGHLWFALKSAGREFCIWKASKAHISEQTWSRLLLSLREYTQSENASSARCGTR